MFYFLINDSILEIVEYCKKFHSSITHFADQTFISTSRKFKDPLQEAKKKKKKNEKKLKLKNNKAHKCNILVRKNDSLE